MTDHTSDFGSAWIEDDVDSDHESPSQGLDSDSPLDSVDDEIDTLLVTVSNPAASVSTTAMLNGRIVTVELAHSVADWSEAQLADEIVVLATLARKKALAAQHSFTAAFMQQLGHDPAATRGLLERELGLPAPDDVLAEKARILAARYQDDD
ncbi:YbaB/EbfC family DNA-binding protein [Mycobacterium sp. NPDC006124]|uniref:YbaB/EbfC family DNA-binding protein n=1 Tax=Mycobacterium sp. NPDC006124 TaxID=3156729 RepID=UPI0033A43B5F